MVCTHLVLGTCTQSIVALLHCAWSSSMRPRKKDCVDRHTSNPPPSQTLLSRREISLLVGSNVECCRRPGYWCTAARINQSTRCLGQGTNQTKRGFPDLRLLRPYSCTWLYRRELRVWMAPSADCIVFGTSQDPDVVVLHKRQAWNLVTIFWRKRKETKHGEEIVVQRSILAQNGR